MFSKFGQLINVTRRFWPYLVFTAAAISLFLLPKYFPTPEKVKDLESRLVAAGARSLQRGRIDEAKQRLNRYLDDFGNDAQYRGNAMYYLGRVNVAEAIDIAPPADPNKLRESLRRFHKAHESGQVGDLRIKAAILEVADLFRQAREEEDGLNALKSLQGLFPDDDDLILEEAQYRARQECPNLEAILAVLDDYDREATSPTQKTEAALARADILIQLGESEQALQLLDTIEDTAKDSAAYSEYLLTLGKMALASGKLNLAQRALTTAGNPDRAHPPTPAIRAESRYYLGHLNQRGGNPKRARELWDSIRLLDSPLPAIARVRIGESLVDDEHYAAGLETILEGLTAIAFKTGLAGTDFNLDAFLARINQTRVDRVAWLRGQLEDHGPIIAGANLNPVYKELDLITQVLREGIRLEQDSINLYFTLSDTYVDLAALQTEEADLMENDGARRRQLDLADAAHVEAGHALIPVLRKVDISTDRRNDALHRIAGSYFQGSFFHGSAFYDRQFLTASRPEEGDRLDVIYRLGLALQKLGQHQDAITVFGFLRQEFPDEPFITPRGAILQAVSYEALGHRKQAIATVEGMLEEPDDYPVISPETEPWKEAQYYLGHLLANGALSQKADLEMAVMNAGESATPPDWGKHEFFDWQRKAKYNLNRFLDRYGASSDPHLVPLLVATHYDLGNLLVAEASLPHQEAEAARRLYASAARQFEQASAYIEYPFRDYPLVLGEVDPIARIKHAYYLRADMSFRQGDYQEAIRLYRASNNRFLGARENIWGYLGSAIAYERIDNLLQSDAFLERARNFLEDHRDAFENQPRPFGAEFWNREIELLAERLKRRLASE
jgi:tetratricopeptide (TPR) repeat protein